MATVELQYKTEMPAKHSIFRIPARLQYNKQSSCERYQKLLEESPDMAAQVRAIEFIDVQPECIQSTAQLIHVCPQLEYVSYKGYMKKDAHQLSADAVDFLMRSAIRRQPTPNNPSVGPRYIGFPDHRIGDTGFEKILSVINHDDKFKGYDFTRMNLGEASLRGIALHLQTSTNVEELHLRGNEEAFTPDGRLALCNALRVNKTLKVLNVADTGLGPNIAEIIEATKVKELNVAHNSCDEDADLTRLFAAIQNNGSIEKLVMNDVLGDVDEIPDVVVTRWKDLLAAVGNNNTIQQIITQDPEVDDMGDQGEVSPAQAQINELSRLLDERLSTNRGPKGSPSSSQK